MSSKQVFLGTCAGSLRVMKKSPKRSGRVGAIISLTSHLSLKFLYPVVSLTSMLGCLRVIFKLICLKPTFLFPFSSIPTKPTSSHFCYLNKCQISLFEFLWLEKHVSSLIPFFLLHHTTDSLANPISDF